MQLATPIPSQQLSMDTSRRDREENASDKEEGEIVEVDEEFAAPNRIDNETYGADNFHKCIIFFILFSTIHSIQNT